jgi:DNA-binding transcriptional ArsR family regulator
VRTHTDLLAAEALADAAECLKVLAHADRLRIVDILSRGDRPVHEVAALCGLPHHQACGHLRLLKGHGLLSSERDGRLVKYRIADPRLLAILACIRETCAR